MKDFIVGAIQWWCRSSCESANLSFDKSVVAETTLSVSVIVSCMILSGLALAKDFGCLPDDGHRNHVIGHCASCHSEKLICQNRMNRDNWDDTITWMQKEQNLWPIPKEIRQKILDYLAHHFGEDHRATQKSNFEYLPPIWGRPPHLPKGAGS